MSDSHSISSRGLDLLDLSDFLGKSNKGGWVVVSLFVSPSILKVRVAGWWSLPVSFYRWLGGGISLFPCIVEVRVAAWGSLSLSLFLSFCFILCFGRTGENTCRNFGSAAGLGSQPLRWRRSITQTDREVSIGICRRRDREATAQPPLH